MESQEFLSALFLRLEHLLVVAFDSAQFDFRFPAIQDLWGSSPFNSALRILPFGIAAGVSAAIAGALAPRFPRRILLVVGQVFMGVASALLALTRTKAHFWSYMLPASVIGPTGLSIAYIGNTVAVMEHASVDQQGVVGAIMYTAYQVGATIGLAVTSSITNGVNAKQPLDPVSQYVGYADSWWAMVGVSGILVILSLVFVRD